MTAWAWVMFIWIAVLVTGLVKQHGHTIPSCFCLLPAAQQHSGEAESFKCWRSVHATKGPRGSEEPGLLILQLRLPGINSHPQTCPLHEIMRLSRRQSWPSHPMWLPPHCHTGSHEAADHIQTAAASERLRMVVGERSRAEFATWGFCFGLVFSFWLA